MAEKVLRAPRILAILLQEIWGTIWGAFVAFALPIALGVCSGGSRILKGGGVPLFSTVLMRAHEASNACAQNDEKGDSAEPKEPPWIHH